ncbi:hypothetical protein LR48_Vigan503s004200 [Vigna angularis]|uniref:Uncharacterized protein n=1 Tax=Phaseolus angularis TaxID=3914 RepID=A0A0L9TCB9_PHAAN|nr:hypothetical protein LR48_Vigan503s004200 [Vigna angularis]
MASIWCLPKSSAPRWVPKCFYWNGTRKTPAASSWECFASADQSSWLRSYRLDLALSMPKWGDLQETLRRSSQNLSPLSPATEGCLQQLKVVSSPSKRLKSSHKYYSSGRPGIINFHRPCMAGNQMTKKSDRGKEKFNARNGSR